MITVQVTQILSISCSLSLRHVNRWMMVQLIQEINSHLLTLLQIVYESFIIIIIITIFAALMARLHLVCLVCNSLTIISNSNNKNHDKVKLVAKNRPFKAINQVLGLRTKWWRAELACSLVDLLFFSIVVVSFYFSLSPGLLTFAPAILKSTSCSCCIIMSFGKQIKLKQ